MRSVSVAFLLFLLMSFPVLVLTVSGQHKDSLAGPCMGILAVLCLVLGVGLAGWICGPLHDRSDS